MINNLISGINPLGNDASTGGAIALLSILMVFVILLCIILITEVISKIIEAIEKKTIPAMKEEVVNEPAPVVAGSRLDLNDEDATVAALIASIEYRNEVKKNVRVVSIREVK